MKIISNQFLNESVTFNSNYKKLKHLIIEY